MMVWAIFFTLSCLFSWWQWCWFILRLCSLCCSFLSKKILPFNSIRCVQFMKSVWFLRKSRRVLRKQWGRVSYSHVGLNGSIQNVFIWGVGGRFFFLSGKTREREKSSGRSKTFSATSWGQQKSVLGEKTRPEQSQKHRKLLRDKPPRESARNSTLNLSENHCLYTTVRILHYVCVWDIKQIQLRGDNGGVSDPTASPTETTHVQ